MAIAAPLAYFGKEWGFIALFIVAGIPLLLFLQFWILDRIGFLPRRRRPNQCQRCDYNLTGNVSGICPECGEPIPKEMQEKLTPGPREQ